MVRLKLQLFAYTGNSIVDYLKSVGKDSSFSARKGLAESNGIKNYTGTASQNTQLLNILRSGGSTTTTTPSNNVSATPTASTTSNPTFNGVEQKYVDMAYKEFENSAQADEYLNKRNDNAQKFEDKINAGPQFSQAVTDAFNWLQGQQDYFKNGKTSWDDKILGQLDKIENREKFSYDVDNDQLFQQALASAMNSGKTAMQDTIGQVSALTGGYGSTYATSAGNQAYNSFIEDAYNNLPQYYQMALSAYQQEGEEMYNLLGMYTQMGETEWNRNVDAYNTVFDYANSQRNFEYGMYQDEVTNLYNTMNMYDSFYQQQNTQDLALWQQAIDNAWKTIGQQSGDYWNQKEFDAKYISDGNGGYVSKTGSGSGTSKLTNTEVETLKKLYVEAGGGDAGMTAVDEHLSLIGKNNLGDEGEAALKSALTGEDVPVYYQNWTISNDTKNGNFLGLSPDDNNDEYSNGTDTMTFKELKKAINNSDLSEEEKEKRIEALRKQSKK